MVFDSWYWKQELFDLFEDISRNLKLSSMEEYDKNDPHFRLERALIYSAFVSRLLIDSEKLTDLTQEYTFTVSVFQNIQENPNERLPIFRKCPDNEIYDFESVAQKTIPATYLINQIIHSFIIITFGTNDEDEVIGFFVSSDYDANEVLYYVELDAWKRFVNAVINDDITEMHSHFDEKKKAWITNRK